jgi:3-mercaptopyruvate sulfurtransferase SseA
MGGIIGALVVGLMMVVFLLGQSTAGTGGSAGGAGSTSGGTTNNPPAANPTVPSNDQQASTGSEPPRIELKEFKALYDDPARRPVIIDVRAPQAYQEGHIKGAISFPEAEVDARVNELPKDRLIVAYCQ